MTGKTINNNATVPLILLLPLAFIIIVVFTAWPVLLALIILTLIWKIWSHQQWKQWSQQVNPYFNQLIQENEGCVTPLDLSMTANVTARAAEQYLTRKAEEYGAQAKFYEDRGKVYYFLTASAFRGILQDSEPFIEIESETTQTVDIPPQEIFTETESIPETSTREIAQLVELEEESLEFLEDEEEYIEEELIESEVIEEEEAYIEDELEESEVIEPKTDNSEPFEQILTFKEALEFSDDQDPLEDEELSLSSEGLLTQEDLAKRLNVQSITIGKRKYNRNFPQWSRTQDPEGKSWTYDRKQKLFRPLR